MKVSIITATYNSSKTIADCITSVNDQTFYNIEHIIVDGASKDKTISLIHSLPSRVAKVISEPDKGIYDAMNKGIKIATGDVIGILNSDDFYENEHVINEIVDIFNNNEVDCVHAELYYVNKDNTSQIVRHWKTNDYYAGAFKKGWHPAHPTFFVRKEIYNKYGLFNLEFKLAADFELMLRFIEHYKVQSVYFNKPIVRMRLGGATSKSMKNIIKQNIECYRAFKINDIQVSLLYPLIRLVPKIKQYFHG